MAHAGRIHFVTEGGFSTVPCDQYSIEWARLQVADAGLVNTVEPPRDTRSDCRDAKGLAGQ